eukprot:CAMPEP_0116067126 /NCGR_PEP_ID=MMETSP0322-20121206/10815_1 /TAXON_ID=163516 /ORGANISM="Leptocylindrus danicus var. apora, Strain B651" /LENGTH=492 /DNA_ID=CAMNT_0003553857 /DNA_START=192 /DNA_END=1670 /DNA_ORIENTATION=-
MLCSQSWWLLSFSSSSLIIFPVSYGMEATWTPNEEDGGPLPLSKKQRMELAQLDQAISNSPDPEATLRQVASSNGMDPQELGQMLMRNRQDLEMGAAGGGGGVNGNRVGFIMKVLGALFAKGATSCRKNPRAFAIMFMVSFVTLYAIYSAPRNGLMVSQRSFMFEPPRKFVGNYLTSGVSSRVSKKDTTGCSRRLAHVVAEMPENCITWEKKSGIKNLLSLSVTARKRLSLDSLLENYNNEDDEDTSLAEAEEDYVTELAHQCAITILDSRRFSEYSPANVRFQGPSQSSLQEVARRKSRGGSNGVGSESAAIIMKKLGIFPWGLQPLKLSYEEENGIKSKAIAYQTMKHGHFDGELRLSVERLFDDMIDDEKDDDDQINEDGVVLSVSLVVPKKGKKLNRKKAEKIVDSFVSSMSSSIISETKKTLARQRQSKSYREKITGFASSRRAIRNENEQKLEAMAADRKRRWKRKGAGRYRPSGRRIEGSPRFGS